MIIYGLIFYILTNLAMHKRVTGVIVVCTNLALIVGLTIVASISYYKADLLVGDFGLFSLSTNLELVWAIILINFSNSIYRLSCLIRNENISHNDLSFTFLTLLALNSSYLNLLLVLGVFLNRIEVNKNDIVVSRFDLCFFSLILIQLSLDTLNNYYALLIPLFAFVYSFFKKQSKSDFYFLIILLLTSARFITDHIFMVYVLLVMTISIWLFIAFGDLDRKVIITFLKKHKILDRVIINKSIRHKRFRFGLGKSKNKLTEKTEKLVLSNTELYPNYFENISLKITLLLVVVLLSVELS